jgi:hypothetical protein
MKSNHKYLVISELVQKSALEELHVGLMRCKWKCQEQPMESFPEGIQSLVSRIIDTILLSLAKRGIRANIPKTWIETTYLRRKRLNEFTSWHRDLKFFIERGLVSSELNDAFTLWLLLSEPSRQSSRLLFKNGSAIIEPEVPLGSGILFHTSVEHMASPHQATSPRFSLDVRLELPRQDLLKDFIHPEK